MPPISSVIHINQSITDLHPVARDFVLNSIEEYIRLLDSPATTSENTSNSILTAGVLRNVVTCDARRRVQRGRSYEDSIIHLIQIRTDVDLCRDHAQGCLPYGETSVQVAVRQHRYGGRIMSLDSPGAGESRATSIRSQDVGSAGSRSTTRSSMTSAATTVDGIKKPDIVIKTTFPSASTGATLVPASTSVALVGENKLDSAATPNARTKAGVAQLLIQLLSANEAFGTYLGTVCINTAMTRAFVVGPRQVAIESSLATRPTSVAINDLLGRGDLYRHLPHNLKEQGMDVLWGFTVDAVRLLGRHEYDRPCQKLLPPNGPTWEVLQVPDSITDSDEIRGPRDCGHDMSEVINVSPGTQQRENRADPGDAPAAGSRGPKSSRIAPEGRSVRENSPTSDAAVETADSDMEALAGDDDELPLGADAAMFRPIPYLSADTAALTHLGVQVLLIPESTATRLLAEC